MPNPVSKIFKLDFMLIKHSRKMAIYTFILAFFLSACYIGVKVYAWKMLGDYNSNIAILEIQHIESEHELTSELREEIYLLAQKNQQLNKEKNQKQTELIVILLLFLFVMSYQFLYQHYLYSNHIKPKSRSSHNGI